MTTLLLGGRGKTASRISWLLHAANISFLIASRSTSASSPFTQATFDWLDEESYANPFIKTTHEGIAPITTAYLVPPPIFDLAPPMVKFVDYARNRGVKRFVLLSASTIEKGGPAMGQVHEHLAGLTGIEYAVLRPTWFMGEQTCPGSYLFTFPANGSPRLIASTQELTALHCLHRKFFLSSGASATVHSG